MNIPSDVLLWHACQHLVLNVKWLLNLLSELPIANNQPSVLDIQVIVEL
jgi:hypothetical protein